MYKFFKLLEAWSGYYQRISSMVIDNGSVQRLGETRKEKRKTELLMKYIVFLTENTKCKINGNNRIYIGVHKTNDPSIFDGYLGDSIYVNQASTFMYPKTPLQEDVKKYGVNAFRRVTLSIYDDYKDAYLMEQKIITSSFVLQAHTYNTYIGDELAYRTSKLYQFDLKGKLVKEWNLPVEAADVYNYPLSRFWHACNAGESFLNSFWSLSPEICVEKLKILKNHNCITYVYTAEGKLIREYWNIPTMLKYWGGSETVEDINNAIKYQRPVSLGFYVLNYMTSLFHPSPRKQYLHETFHVYNKDGECLGAYKGKAVMKVINLHSWAKIANIFQNNNGWYKDWYLSLVPTNNFLDRKVHKVQIDVYDKYGTFVEKFDSIAEVRKKYNIPSAKMKRIQQGDKYFGDFIFKYSK